MSGKSWFLSVLFTRCPTTLRRAHAAHGISDPEQQRYPVAVVPSREATTAKVPRPLRDHARAGQRLRLDSGGVVATAARQSPPHRDHGMHGNHGCTATTDAEEGSAPGWRSALVVSSMRLPMLLGHHGGGPSLPFGRGSLRGWLEAGC